jgi:hypothetical protein
MCQGLREAIDKVEIASEGDALAAVLADASRLESKICAAVGAFDADGLFELDGATSAVAWLRNHGQLSGARASSLVRTARRMRKLPVTERAWASGQLSSAQVQAVIANLADDEVTDLFAEHEAEVIPALVPLSVADTAHVMQAWAARAEAVIDKPVDDEPERSLHLSRTFAGRSECKGSFDPEGGELVATALRLATTDDVEGEPSREPATRRADALFDVCRFFLDHQRSCLGGRHRPHLHVVIDTTNGDVLDDETVARLFDGPRLDRTTLRRLLCDAGLHRVLTRGRSSILDYGMTTYTIPASLWAALGIRDEHCRFPGCDRPVHWCEGHHVRYWGNGGPTKLSNLVLLCSRHHHLVHRQGWSLTLQANADVVVTTAEGKILRSSLANAPPVLLRV